MFASIYLEGASCLLGIQVIKSEPELHQKATPFLTPPPPPHTHTQTHTQTHLSSGNNIELGSCKLSPQKDQHKMYDFSALIVKS